MRELQTTISFKTEILVGDGDESVLEILIDRYNNMFTIFINNKEIGFGDYEDTLLDLLNSILFIEQSFITIKIQENLRTQLEQTLSDQIKEINKKGYERKENERE